MTDLDILLEEALAAEENTRGNVTTTPGKGGDMEDVLAVGCRAPVRIGSNTSSMGITASETAQGQSTTRQNAHCKNAISSVPARIVAVALTPRPLYAPCSILECHSRSCATQSGSRDRCDQSCHEAYEITEEQCDSLSDL